MLGHAALAMWWDIPAPMQAEFEDWHSHEHMPERLGIPGFLRGTRWIGLSGQPSYFVLYETAGLETLTGGAYLERLNDPTPWSRKMMPYHLNMVRSLCRVRTSFGRGLAHALATIRFSPSPGSADALADRLAARALPGLPERRGLTAAHLLESQPMAGPQTTEQKIRGKDAMADWVLLICGYDAEAITAAAHELTSQEMPPGAAMGLYRAAYCLTSSDTS
jgi:hypothetical protein